MRYSKSGLAELTSEGETVDSLFGEKVLVVRNGSGPQEVLVQMHGGLFSICMDLTGRKIWGLHLKNAIKLYTIASF